jgi:hypothetical protein
MWMPCEGAALFHGTSVENGQKKKKIMEEGSRFFSKNGEAALLAGGESRPILNTPSCTCHRGCVHHPGLSSCDRSNAHTSGMSGAIETRFPDFKRPKAGV